MSLQVSLQESKNKLKRGALRVTSKRIERAFRRKRSRSHAPTFVPAAFEILTTAL